MSSLIAFIYIINITYVVTIMQVTGDLVTEWLYSDQQLTGMIIRSMVCVGKMKPFNLCFFWTCYFYFCFDLHFRVWLIWETLAWSWWFLVLVVSGMAVCQMLQFCSRFKLPPWRCIENWPKAGRQNQKDSGCFRSPMTEEPIWWLNNGWWWKRKMKLVPVRLILVGNKCRSRRCLEQVRIDSRRTAAQPCFATQHVHIRPLQRGNAQKLWSHLEEGYPSGAYHQSPWLRHPFLLDFTRIKTYSYYSASGKRWSVRNRYHYVLLFCMWRSLGGVCNGY